VSTALVWLRRDLRLTDNPALHEAASRHRYIIPVYIHAPEEAGDWLPGAASRWWRHRSLNALSRELHHHHARLILRRGPSLAALRALIRETGAGAVYWNRLYDPLLIQRDKTIKAALREDGVHAESHNAALLREPWTVQTKTREPYKVFTPFWRTYGEVEIPGPLPVPRLSTPARWPDSLALEDLALLPRIAWYQDMADFWEPGEAGAARRLQSFCRDWLVTYPDNRNRPEVDGTARLSPHLHHGEISPRQVWRAVAERVGGEPLQDNAAEAFLREIGWREFAHHVLFHFPETVEKPMQRRFERYPWREDADALRAWQRGRTGIPLVDAGMRQLWELGWLHNRVRMVVASFLTKNLRVHWLAGDRWFWDTLVDADLASNTLGWQWAAGCGADAAPYFRVFNPVSQADKFDPEGRYIARFVPELAKLPMKYRARPWELPEGEARRLGFHPGRDYPEPLVDLKRSRAEALAGYQTIKG